MKQETLTIPELLSAINYMTNMHNSSDSINTYFKSGVHKLVYIEMNKFSKQDLENAHDPQSKSWNIKKAGCLYHLILSTRNPLFFSVLLSKGAFKDELSKETKWVLKNMPNPSLELYERLYEIEELKKYVQYSTIEYSRLTSLLDFSIKRDTQEKIELFDKILNDFLDKNIQKIIEYAYEKIDKQKDSAMIILEKCREKNIDVKKNYNYILDGYLPADDTSSFFISSIDTKKINALLEAGLKFSEETYTYKGKNLFLAIAGSPRLDLIEMIIPYLSNIEPKSGNIDEQTKIIDNMKNVVIKENYKKLLMKRISDKLNTITPNLQHEKKIKI